MTGNTLVLDLDRIYHCSDAVAFYLRRAAFFGRETWVAMRMGNEDSAYTRAGIAFRFMEFLKVAFPLMLISIVISHVYLYFRYL